MTIANGVPLYLQRRRARANKDGLFSQLRWRSFSSSLTFGLVVFEISETCSRGSQGIIMYFTNDSTIYAVLSESGKMSRASTLNDPRNSCHYSPLLIVPSNT